MVGSDPGMVGTESGKVGRDTCSMVSCAPPCGANGRGASQGLVCPPDNTGASGGRVFTWEVSGGGIIGAGSVWLFLVGDG